MDLFLNCIFNLNTKMLWSQDSRFLRGQSIFIKYIRRLGKDVLGIDAAARELKFIHSSNSQKAILVFRIPDAISSGILVGLAILSSLRVKDDWIWQPNWYSATHQQKCGAEKLWQYCPGQFVRYVRVLSETFNEVGSHDLEWIPEYYLWML